MAKVPQLPQRQHKLNWEHPNKQHQLQPNTNRQTDRQTDKQTDRQIDKLDDYRRSFNRTPRTYRVFKIKQRNNSKTGKEKANVTIRRAEGVSEIYIYI